MAKKKSDFKNIFIGIIIGIFLILLFQMFQSSNSDQVKNKTFAQKDDIVALRNHVKFSKYTQQVVQNTDFDGNYIEYKFTEGQPEKRDIYNNYKITFPKTWKIYTHSNLNQAGDARGVNLLLKKENDLIIVSQQLSEAGTCIFDDGMESEGMSRPCSLVKDLGKKGENWKVYLGDSILGRGGGDPWNRYSICDQDNYAKGISEYKIPTDHDKKLCSPWTNVGSIDFFSVSMSEDNLEEFYAIIKSIKVIK